MAHQDLRYLQNVIRSPALRHETMIKIGDERLNFNKRAETFKEKLRKKIDEFVKSSYLLPEKELKKKLEERHRIARQTINKEHQKSQKRIRQLIENAINKQHREQQKQKQTLPVLLGSGGYSKVYRISQEKIKKVPTHAQGSSRHTTILQSYKNQQTILNDLKRYPEISLLKEKIGHYPFPNVYNFQGAGLTMQYLGKTDLFDMVVKDRNLLPKIATIANQLIQILIYLSKHYIVHRDIKPENIMVVQKNGQIQIKLIDFGNACKTQDHNCMNKVFGTIDYWSPEIICARANRTAYAMSAYNMSAYDVWCVGMVMYFILYRTHPKNVYYKNHGLHQQMSKKSVQQQLSYLYCQQQLSSFPNDVFKITFQTPDNLNILMYKNIMEKLLRFNPTLRLAGFSTTLKKIEETPRNIFLKN